MALRNLQTTMNLDVDETEDAVTTGPAILYGWYIGNQHATDKRYIKFYDGTTTDVTVGTTTPKLTLPLSAGAQGHVEFSRGIPFYTAITVAATTGLAATDTGAPSAGDVAVNAFWEPMK